MRSTLERIPLTLSRSRRSPSRVPIQASQLSRPPSRPLGPPLTLSLSAIANARNRTASSLIRVYLARQLPGRHEPPRDQGTRVV